VGKEGIILSQHLQSKQDTILKLTALGLLLRTATAKVDIYLRKHYEVINQMHEDEDVYDQMVQFYLDSKFEMKEEAEEFLVISNESEQKAEITYRRWADGVDHD